MCHLSRIQTINKLILYLIVLLYKTISNEKWVIKNLYMKWMKKFQVEEQADKNKVIVQVFSNNNLEMMITLMKFNVKSFQHKTWYMKTII